MSEPWLPESYEVPQGPSKYLKFKTGTTLIRILASPIAGWEGWKEIDGKATPVRRHEEAEFKMNDVDDPSKIKHFLAMPVWNYAERRVQVLEITQKTIQRPMEKYSRNKQWGSPLDYDFAIESSGQGKDTEYTVIANPKNEIDSDALMAWNEIKPNFDLNRLFDNGDPFGDEAANTNDYLEPTTPFALSATTSTLLRDIFTLSKKLWPTLSAAPDPKSHLLKIVKRDFEISLTNWESAAEEQLQAIFMAMKSLEAAQFTKDTASDPTLAEIPF